MLVSQFISGNSIIQGIMPSLEVAWPHCIFKGKTTSTLYFGNDCISDM